jgi:hypothetical protein
VRHGATGADTGVAAIAAAIDRLTAEVRGNPGSTQHTQRVAEIWLMMASLDPGLARSIERYETPTIAALGTAEGKADGPGLR